MERNIYIDNKITDYTISDNGIVFNTKTGKQLKGSLTISGYQYVRISVDGKKYRFYIHRLVAEYFLNPPENDFFIVNHINGKKDDNCVENLEWIPQSENVKHAHATGLISKKRKKEENNYIESEIWVETENKDYLVSNMGRVKSLKYGKERILRQSLVNGYYKVVFSENNKQSSHLVHTLVYSCFHPEQVLNKGFVINHKDGNKTNNRLENLEYVSASDNVLKALYEQSLNNSLRPVMCFKDGMPVKQYQSIAQAAKELSLDGSSISKVCKGIYKTTKGYSFSYAEESSTTKVEEVLEKG